MSSNNLALLNSILDEYHTKNSVGLNEDESFERFVSEIFFKKYDFSDEEVSSGLVGGKNDWGIDGVYIVFNDRNILDIEDIDMDNLSKNFDIQLFIFQFKNKTSFEENVVNKFNISYRYFVDLEKELPTNSKAISQDIIDKMTLFRNAVTKSASKYPKVKITFIHASKGDPSQILVDQSKNYAHKEKINNLIEDVEGFNLGTSTKCEYLLLGVEELKRLNQYEKSYTGSLRQNENPIYVEYGEEENKQKGYIATITLKDYFDFLVEKDDNGNFILKEHLFESNIRDYQNKTEVNKSIEETLRNPDNTQDFWWLNNGITILADVGSLTGKTFSLENIQIVNGLQTSYSIYNAFKDNNLALKEDKRTIFCKIIITEEKDSRDAIIKATNSQNPVSPSLLRSTDNIQRDIEQYFQMNSFYYDRRKNYYKNKGKDTKRIISINYLAQSLTAILKSNPSKARTSPTILTKKDEDYNSLFNKNISIEVYLYVVLIRKKMEEYLVTKFNPIDDIDESINKYFKLHLTRILASLLTKSEKIRARDISKLTSEVINEISDKKFENSIEILKTIINNHPAEASNMANFSKNEKSAKLIDSQVKLFLAAKNKVTQN
ncbi:AIPR family protein [Aerococcus urinaeequi]|uniref:AIPR family protein n=1 Tax=Aerococcus urinaeequi TaxID=51665 RepID=UPI003B49695C